MDKEDTQSPQDRPGGHPAPFNPGVPRPEGLQRAKPPPLPTVIGILIVAVIMPFFGPAIALAAGHLGREHKRTSRMFTIMGISMLVLHILLPFVVIYSVFNYYNERDKAVMETARANLKSIQAAIEAYAESNGGHYPIEFNVLLVQGYIDQLPPNPFSTSNEPMAVNEFKGMHHFGNFTYYPVVADGVASSYYLVMYGGFWERSILSVGATHMDDGLDIDRDKFGDHVILVLTPDTEYDLDNPLKTSIFFDAKLPGDSF